MLPRRGYDKAGNVTSQTDGINTVTYAYDKANRQTATTDGLNHTTTTAYDAAGNATAVTDALNKITTYVYDDLNRQVAVTDPNNHTTTTLYDADGNVVGTLDPLGDLSQTGYDADGRVIWQLDPDRNLTQTFYDAAGNETALTDPVNNTTTFAYDTLNRQTGQTNPNGSLVTMAYDAASRLTSTIDADSRTITYAYDPGDHLIGATWKNSSGTVVNTLTYTYDQNGNMLTAADTNGTITFAYDNRDRVTVQTDVHGVTLTFSYDAADRRTLVQDSLGGTVTSVYDAANRLTSRQLGAVGTLTNAARVDFAYNKRDALTTLTRFSDAAGTTVVGTTIYSYDNANRVTTILHDNASNATLSYYAYNYDAADRVTSQNWKTGSTTGAETYTYDAASQLLTDATASGTSTYTYDANGNRTIAGYQTGTGNELTNDGTWTYTYDQAGNMTQKANANNQTVVTYSYDNMNHLTAVNETISGATTLTVSYTYDVLGDRVEQDKWKGSGGGTVKTRFAYDGQNIWADTDTSNNVLARYLYGYGADQILIRSVANNQTNAGVAFYLTDLLGSVRDLENTSQSLIDHLDYSAFGVATETSASSGDRNKFDGQWDDTDIGFVLTPARPDSPSTGRFVIQDPTGFGAGDSNLYRIVGNDPTNVTDPSGLETVNAKGGNITWDITIPNSKGDIVVGEFTYKPGPKNDHNAISFLQVVRIGAVGGLTTFPGRGTQKHWKMLSDDGMDYIDHVPGSFDGPWYGAKWDSEKKDWVDNVDSKGNVWGRLGWGPRSPRGKKVGKGNNAEMTDQVENGYGRHGLGTVTIILETAAVDIDTGEVLGVVEWGFEIADRKNSNIELYEPSYGDSVTNHFRAAVRRWNNTPTGGLAIPGDDLNPKSVPHWWEVNPVPTLGFHG